MDEQQVDAVFDILMKASLMMQQHEVREAFAILDGIQRPNLDEWPAAVQRAYEELRRAEGLAGEAEALAAKGDVDGARVLWGQVEDACTAARDPDRMYLRRRIGTKPVSMGDPWPDVVRDFENYVLERRVGKA